MPETIKLSEMDAEDIQRLIRHELAESHAIDAGRQGLFGNGLMKSLANNEKDSDDRLKKTMDFFKAYLAEDWQYLANQTNTYEREAQGLVDSGRMSMLEYKTLAPWNETTNSAGGYTVPPEFAADLARNLGKYGFARRYFRNVAMKRNKWEVAGLLTKPSVAVYAENTTIANSKPVLDQLILTAIKIAAIFSTTNEALEDANIDTYAVMLDIFTEQFQLLEDQIAFANTNTYANGLLWYGAGAITSGIAANGARAYSRTNLSTGGATGYPQMSDAASTTDAWFDHLLMLQGQPSALFEGGKYFVDQNILVAMLAMRDSNKRFLADLDTSFTVSMPLEGQPKMYFRGYEVVPLPSGVMLTYDASAHVSTPFSVFTNPNKSWTLMGIRGGFVVDTLKEATIETVSLAANDLQAIRMKERVAFGTARPETMAVLRTDAS